MAELRTEEEQIDAIRGWWKSNGKSLLLTIAVSLALVFGWRAWQQRQAAEAANASAIYQNLLEAVGGALGDAASDAQISTAGHLAGTLKTEYEDSSYARLGALLMARLAVEQGKADDALTELDWVLAHEPEQPQKVVTLLRKARILGDQGKYAEALALLDGLDAGEFEASYQELKGDLLHGEGRADEARQAYLEAMQAAEAGGARPLLKMKLDDLAVEEG